MDNELPLPSPEIETPPSSNLKFFIIGIVLLIIILGAGAWFFILNKKPQPSPAPVVTQQASHQASQNFQSSYLQKTVSIKAPEGFDLNSLIISGDRLNGIVVKMSDPHHFLIESKDENSQVQVIPVVTDSQTAFYLFQPSSTPPDGPFSGIKLPGDYTNSIKELSLYTIQFQVTPEASDSASLPWVKDSSGSYVAKAVLLDEK